MGPRKGAGVFVIQTTCMSPDSEGDLYKKLSTLPYLSAMRFLRVNYLRHDTTHLFLGENLTPTRTLLMAVMRGKVKLVKFEDFETMYSSSPSVPINFFKDCVPKEGLTLNGMFIKSLSRRSEFTLNRWKALVSLQNQERRELAFDILHEGGAKVLPYTLEQVLDILEIDDSFGSSISHIIVDPAEETKPDIVKLYCQIVRRKLKIDVIKFEFLPDLLMSMHSPPKEDYLVSFRSLDEDYSIKLEDDFDDGSVLRIKRESFSPPRYEEEVSAMDTSISTCQDVPIFVEFGGPFTKDAEVQTDSDICQSDETTSPNDTAITELLMPLKKVETVLKIEIEETRDMVKEEFREISKLGLKWNQEVMLQLGLIQKKLEETSMRSMMLETQNGCLKDELRNARSVSVNTQTDTEDQDRFESPTPPIRPYYMEYGSRNAPDDRPKEKVNYSARPQEPSGSSMLCQGPKASKRKYDHHHSTSSSSRNESSSSRSRDTQCLDSLRSQLDEEKKINEALDTKIQSLTKECEELSFRNTELIMFMESNGLEPPRKPTTPRSPFKG